MASRHKSLYLAPFSGTPLDKQKDAARFIGLFGLPMKVTGLVERNKPTMHPYIF